MIIHKKIQQKKQVHLKKLNRNIKLKLKIIIKTIIIAIKIKKIKKTKIS